ncbi:protein-serine/threonine kinase [Clonorchis sinensis]|uniref:Protein-serine/threonine kinase n=1 Tax=Clonorchis sinensis TaxID=79923 RepID=G7YY06_CLOSI|nr:protein-serine/threonine kinase [Clonorchis sinensis]
MVREPYIQESVVVHSLLSSRLNTVCDSCLRVSDTLCSCAACGVMHYCNRHCQRTMWPIHRAECKQYGAVKHVPNAQIRLLLRMILLKASETCYTYMCTHSG